jgi:hypothetical protein
MDILPFYSQYVYSLLLHVLNCKHRFTKYFEGHNHNTRSANNFHVPINDLTKYQKGAHYPGIKFFYLPTYIKCGANEVTSF